MAGFKRKLLKFTETMLENLAFFRRFPYTYLPFLVSAKTALAFKIKESKDDI
jgi:hypothetical protein